MKYEAVIASVCFFTAFGSTFGETCADNCFCQEDKARVTITSCSLLEFKTSNGSLLIHGILCPEQRLFFGKNQRCNLC